VPKINVQIGWKLVVGQFFDRGTKISTEELGRDVVRSGIIIFKEIYTDISRPPMKKIIAIVFCSGTYRM
jgi:hypothetical protein